MSEQTDEEVYGFLYAMEEWAWESLRSEGLTDDEIWDLILSDETEIDRKPSPESENRHTTYLEA